MQLGTSLFREEPLPYLVYQPLPWQIQCVTQSRRTSRDSEVSAACLVSGGWERGLVCWPSQSLYRDPASSCHKSGF